MRPHYLLFAFLLSLLSHEVKAQEVPIDGAMQYYRNYTAKEYAGDNRNMAVECDSLGRVYVANFRGLLTYDGVNWHMTYTDAVSRVTSVYRAKNGKIWFGGNNLVGSVEWTDSIRLDYVVSDSENQDFGDVSEMYEAGGKICFTTNLETAYMIEGKELRPIPYPEAMAEKGYNGTPAYVPELNTHYHATSKKGLVCLDERQDTVYYCDAVDGLCSSMVNDVAYDGKGGLWGATNNGLFWMWASEVLTYYTEEHGLNGHINAVRVAAGDLFVGTMEGLYILDQEAYRFLPIPEISLACWSLDLTRRQSLLAATTDGVYEYQKGLLRRLTDKTAVCIYVEDESSYITAELDGLYRHYFDGRTECLGAFPNVTKIVRALDGKGIWAISTDGYGTMYYLEHGAKAFRQKQNRKLTLLFSYIDDKDVRWTSKANDKGLQCKALSGEETPEALQQWLEAFNDMTIQTMYLSDGIAWVGTNEGLVRLDIPLCLESKLYEPKLYIREFRQNGNNVYLSYANDKHDPVGQTRYSYRTNPTERWSPWLDDTDQNLNLAPGNYELAVRSMDAFGQIAYSETIRLSIPQPWWLRWYAILGALSLLMALSYLFYLYRLRKMRHEQERLERIVDERTQEVRLQKDEIEAQKDEIEAKSETLATALSDLKNAQSQLLRQEREATVGKLTKGLIDRILNPMNYINNFAHLTLGLVGDMKGDLEDLKEEVGETDNDEVADLFDDTEDVTDMMTTNLSKIEEHGQAATRILKAMEEMLKDRSTKCEPMDIKLICQQSYEMLQNYYADDIRKYGIKVTWERPEDPIVADVNAELLSKCFMSMLANSIYAIKKKAERSPEGYQPEVTISICPPNGEVAPTITFYDNGIGIEESIIDKVFDPFFTTKPTAEAPGVGLYLSQQIIQDFGGKITVESEKDVYTEFRIELP